MYIYIYIIVTSGSIKEIKGDEFDPFKKGIRSYFDTIGSESWNFAVLSMLRVERRRSFVELKFRKSSEIQAAKRGEFCKYASHPKASLLLRHDSQVDEKFPIRVGSIQKFEYTYIEQREFRSLNHARIERYRSFVLDRKI